MQINQIYEELNSSAVAFSLTNYFSFNVMGRDAVRYLQGRITQDVKTLTANHAKQSLVLTPQGKIQGQFWISKSEEGFLIISDPLSVENREEFEKNLLRFKVADDVQLSPLNKHSVIAIQGANAEKILQDLGIACSLESLAVSDGVFEETKTICLSLPISTDPGFLLIVENKVAPLFFEKLKSLKINIALEEDFNLLRIPARLPVYGLDFSENSIAPELFNLEQKISFTKGCYSGQEVVERATALGKAPKKLICLEGPILSGDLAGLEITHLADGEQSVGKTIRGVSLEFQNKTYFFAQAKTKELIGSEFSVSGKKFNKTV